MIVECCRAAVVKLDFLFCLKFGELLGFRKGLDFIVYWKKNGFQNEAYITFFINFNLKQPSFTSMRKRRGF